MGTSLTLERYAEMRAEMEAGMLRDEVLARSGIGPEEWIGCQREWLDKMGAEIEIGRFELSSRYNRAFLDRQRAMAAASVHPPSAPPAAAPTPAVPDGGRLPAAVAPRPAAAAAPLPLASPPQPGAPPIIPSEERNRGLDPLAQTLPAGMQLGRPALPFQKAAAAPPPPTAVAPTGQARKPPGAMSVTLCGDTEPTSPALPFEKKASELARQPAGPAAATAASAPVAPPRGDPLGSTVSVDPAELARVRASLALPFAQPNRSRSSPPAPMPPGQGTASSSATPQDPGTIEEQYPSGSTSPKAATPFERGKGSRSSPPAATPFEQPKRPPSGNPPRGPQSPAGAPDVPRTVALPIVEIGADPAAVRGKPAPSQEDGPRLTVEQLAALLEDLNAAPNAALVLARFGLTEGQFQAIGAHWTEHVRQHPGDLERLSKAREAYRTSKVRGR